MTHHTGNRADKPVHIKSAFCKKVFMNDHLSAKPAPTFPAEPNHTGKYAQSEK